MWRNTGHDYSDAETTAESLTPTCVRLIKAGTGRLRKHGCSVANVETFTEVETVNGAFQIHTMTLNVTFLIVIFENITFIASALGEVYTFTSFVFALTFNALISLCVSGSFCDDKSAPCVNLCSISGHTLVSITQSNVPPDVVPPNHNNRPL